MRRLGADLEEKQEPRGRHPPKRKRMMHEISGRGLTRAAIEKPTLALATETTLHAPFRPFPREPQTAQGGGDFLPFPFGRASDAQALWAVTPRDSGSVTRPCKRWGRARCP